MDRFKLLLIFLWSLFFLYLFYEIIKYIEYKKWLKKLEKNPLPQNIKKILENIEYYKKLPPDLKKIIDFKIQWFLKEKEFYGVGINITDEIKVNIAFFACLLTIAYKYFCYPNLKYIFVYPNTIILHKRKIEEIVSNEEILIEGEATNDAVIIVWNEAKREIEKNTRNVIVHEFAHELDYANGNIDGIPPLEGNKLTEFSKVMFKEYEKFKEKTLKGRFLGKYHLIDKYATTNRAEFFAVMSEYFFIKPEVLKKHFPDIYKELKNFYKIDTYKIKGEK